ncbi:hypothetical protein BDQ12DRAFT_693865 [Crucibulum laeve]|uniref:F-box domain-containing protein n=1 Tax=Crucibulum laeve TaxID=68775 RepID=A0A5C3LFG8_9AGAR|nr:hypothetical protein BDQ12DRAFT_693865 [Crucibulum laeve]
MAEVTALNESQHEATTVDAQPAGKLTIQSISDPDILSLIFQSLDTQYLAWVACTCKTFLEPALNQLWRSLDSLFPLFRILPAFVKSDGTYVVRGHIHEKDWARFDWYACRVRTFSYARDPDALDIAMHVYFRIAQLRHTPLLPALQHLYCPSTSQSDFLISAICLFLTPSLQSIKFEDITNIEDKLVGTFLHTLLTDGASLDDITLRGHGLSKDSLSFVAEFPSLQALELSGMGENLDLNLVKKIGNLGHLKDLVIDFSNCPISLESLDELDNEIGLRGLRNLTITASLPFVQSFLAQMSVASHLHTLFVLAPADTVVQRKEFLAEVAARWAMSLRRIALIHDPMDPEEEGLSVHALGPLLPLRDLEYLCVEGFTMEISDEDITLFANTWPKLRSLLLPFAPPSATRPTIKSLSFLAEKCPKLEVLRLPLDVNELPVMPTNQLPDPHRLESLIIATVEDHWELRDLLRLARHIDYYFPWLETVESQAGRDGERLLLLQEMIRMYQAVRNEAVSSRRVRTSAELTT